MKSKKETAEDGSRWEEWSGGLRQLISTCHGWPVFLKVSKGLSNIMSPSSSSSSSSLSSDDKEYWRQRKLMETGSLFLAISIETMDRVQLISEDDNYVSMSVDFPLTFSLSKDSDEALSFRELQETGWCKGEHAVKKIYPRKLVARPKYAWLPDGVDMGTHIDHACENIYQGGHENPAYTSNIFSKPLYFVKTFQEQFLLCVSVGSIPDTQPSANHLFFIPAYYPLHLVPSEDYYDGYDALIAGLASMPERHNCSNPFALEISMAPCDQYEPIELIEEGRNEVEKDDNKGDNNKNNIKEIENKMDTLDIETSQESLSQQLNSTESLSTNSVKAPPTSSLTSASTIEHLPTSQRSPPFYQPRTHTKKRLSVTRREAFVDSKGEGGKRRAEIRKSIESNSSKINNNNNFNTNDDGNEENNNETIDDRINQKSYNENEDVAPYNPDIYRLDPNNITQTTPSNHISSHPYRLSQSASNLPSNNQQTNQSNSQLRTLSDDNSIDQSTIHSTTLDQTLPSTIKFFSAPNSWEILNKNPPKPILLPTSTHFPITSTHPNTPRSRPLPPIPPQKNVRISQKIMEKINKYSKISDEDFGIKGVDDKNNNLNLSNQDSLKSKKKDAFSEANIDYENSCKIHIINIDEKKKDKIKKNNNINNNNSNNNNSKEKDITLKFFSKSLKTRKVNRSHDDKNMDLISRDDTDAYMNNKNKNKLMRSRDSTSTIYKMNKIKNNKNTEDNGNYEINNKNDNNKNNNIIKNDNNKKFLSKQPSNRSHSIASSLNSLPKKLKFWRLSSKNDVSKETLEITEFSRNSSIQADSIAENPIHNNTNNNTNNNNNNNHSVLTYDEETQITLITSLKNKKKILFNNSNNNNNINNVNIIETTKNKSNVKNSHNNSNIQEEYDVIGGYQATNHNDVRKLSRSLGALCDVIGGGNDDDLAGGNDDDDSFYESIIDHHTETFNHHHHSETLNPHHHSETLNHHHHSETFNPHHHHPSETLNLPNHHPGRIKPPIPHARKGTSNRLNNNQGVLVEENDGGGDDAKNDENNGMIKSDDNKDINDTNMNDNVNCINTVNISNNDEHVNKIYIDMSSSHYIYPNNNINNNDIDNHDIDNNITNNNNNKKNDLLSNNSGSFILGNSLNDNNNNPLYDEKSFPNNNNSTSNNNNNNDINNDDEDNNQTYLTSDSESRWQNVWEIPTNVKDFNVSEVMQCLNLLGMGGYGDTLKKEQVDGSLLSSLDLEVLVEHFGFKKFDAIKLLKFWKEGWRPKIDKL